MASKKKLNKPSKHTPKFPAKKKQDQKSFLKLNSAWVYPIGVFIICLLVFIIRLNFIHIPFERDEGAYSYYGRLLLDGKTPYISFYETKPPGLFYTYALIQLLAGGNIEAIHVAGIVVNLLTIVLMFLVGSKLMDKPSGLIAAASFALLSLTKGISGFSVQAEHMVVFFAIAGFWLLLKAFENDKWFSFLAAGAVIAMSLMIKQNGLFYLLLGGVILIVKYLSQKPLAIKKLFINGSIYSAGALALIGAFIFVIFMQHAIADMWKWVYVIPKSYTSQVKFSQGMQYFKGNFGRLYDANPVLLIISAFGFILAFFNDLPLYKKLFIILFPLFALVSITPGFWFYNHYFILLTPSFALCTGSMIYSGKSVLSNYVRPAVTSVVLTTVSIFIMIQNISTNREYYFNPDYTQILREIYGMNPFPEAWEISSVIKQRTNKGDIVGVLGGEPEVFIYTDRRGPSAHDMAILLYGGSGIKTTDWQKKYIADVERTKPKYFVMFNNPISLMTWSTDTTIFKWFSRYMDEHYKLEGIADVIDAFQTKYVWDNNVNTYKMQGKEGPVLVFRRKEL
jgi:4-amino-4-deoxy-L-arabinose transferase-like glycosyltransferase